MEFFIQGCVFLFCVWIHAIPQKILFVTTPLAHASTLKALCSTIIYRYDNLKYANDL